MPPRNSNTRLVYSTGEERSETPGRPEPAAGRSPGIRLRLDRRASGRVVTVVTGLPGSHVEVSALAKTLKTVCGTGGTVKNGALELQGDHRERVEAALAEQGLRSKRSGG